MYTKQNPFAEQFPKLFANSRWTPEADESWHALLSPLWERESALLHEAEQRFPLVSHYISGVMHDSWVVDIEESPDNVRMHINGSGVHVVMDAVCALYDLDIEEHERVSVVVFEFSEGRIRSYRANRRHRGYPLAADDMHRTAKRGTR